MILVVLWPLLAREDPPHTTPNDVACDDPCPRFYRYCSCSSITMLDAPVCPCTGSDPLEFCEYVLQDTLDM